MHLQLVCVCVQHLLFRSPKVKDALSLTHTLTHTYMTQIKCLFYFLHFRANRPHKLLYNVQVSFKNITLF